MVFKILGIVFSLFALVMVVGGLTLAVYYELSSCQLRGLIGEQRLPVDRVSFSELLKKFPEARVAVSTPILTSRRWFYEKFDLVIYSVYGGPASNIRAEWWRSSRGCHQKAVVILPIAGSGDPGGYIAWYLVNFGGYDVLRIRGGGQRFLENEPLIQCDSLAAVKEKLSRASYYMQIRLVNYWRVVDWLKKGGDYKAVNVVGVSLGAIEGSILSLHPEINKVVLVLGGGGLAEILSYSEEPFVKTWRETLRQKTKSLLEQEKHQLSPGGRSMAVHADPQEISRLMTEMLEETFVETEPLRYAPGLNSQKVLMINAKKDRTVPLSNTLKLWLAANQPRLILFPTDHRGLAWYTPYVLYRISRFFKQDD